MVKATGYGIIRKAGKSKVPMPPAGIEEGERLMLHGAKRVWGEDTKPSRASYDHTRVPSLVPPDALIGN
jgi:hypothetical protein